MEVVKCWKCELPSEITIQASGFFCSSCFVEYFRQKYRKIIGASKLIRDRDLVVFAFDGSASGCAMLNVISTFQQHFAKANSENMNYKRKNRYITKALHMTDSWYINIMQRKS
ncbi:Oidioi.mRNA.OKI2018_I69.XSR.g16452.t2.cds [Oikopleura dioica]|uniref:Oidioi.mRNA.OKI2018_I69.XSR.g16452.t2.cds n=1 Tax=Oikopleura dioica TaxID=34765 RepID=A0ABN7SG53_OIKDI|nr:Oidioi.mRNA.OKI2018_I69.XSR.g16452.t2.cds [Oikopleura dioica]